MHLHLHLLFGLLGAAAGSPAVPSGAFCSVVDSLVTIAKAQTSATSYCSSFLSIPTKTITTTSTSIATTTSSVTSITSTEVDTTYTSTDTLAYTSISTSIISITATATASTTSSACYTSTSVVAARKRAPTSKPPVSKPPAFGAYSASAAISSACSCLSIPTPVSTVQATTLSTTTVFTTILKGSTSLTPAATTTSTTVESVLTSTTTITTTTTTTTTAAPSFYLYADGAYLDLSVIEGDVVDDAAFVTSIQSSEFLLSLDPGTCALIAPNDYDYIAYTDSGVGGDAYYVTFGNAASADDYGPTIYCNINQPNNQLLCWRYATETPSSGNTKTVDGVLFWEIGPTVNNVDFVATAEILQ